MGKYQVLWSVCYRKNNDFFASIFYSHFDVIDEPVFFPVVFNLTSG